MRSLFFSIVLFCQIDLLFAQVQGEHRDQSGEKDTTNIAKQTSLGLRGSRPTSAAHTFYLTDQNKQGFVVYDPSDHTSADDSAMTFVTANGMRFKRDVEQGVINVKWFGARGNSVDDWYPIQKAINYILNTNEAGRTLFFPAGTYVISKPLIIARRTANGYKQVSITLAGPANSKNISAGYASISPAFSNTFAIGIQLGKGVTIRDLLIQGRFTFPGSLNQIQVDTLAFSEWKDGVSRDRRLSPYAGIVIDPFSDAGAYPDKDEMYPGLHDYYLPGMSRAGSTAVQVIGCSIRNFIVGIMITPSNQQNGELIDVIDCELSGNKVAYSMSQAQSKECHVQRLKCWQPTHTVFDNSHYGFRHGDGAAVPMVDGVNIAGYVKQLCSIWAPSFNGSFRNVYAEGLFRIGFVGGPASIAFEDCQLDFSTQDPGIPYPDFYVLGSGVTFQNCLLRLYPGVPGARLILSGTNNHYEGGAMNAPPVAVNIDNNGINPVPDFHNIIMFYSGGILGSSRRSDVNSDFPFKGSNGSGTDPVYDGNTYSFRNPYYGADVFYKITYHDNYERTARLSGTPVIHADKSSWTAWFKLNDPSDASLLRNGDFILTTGLHYQDEFESLKAATYPVGIIRNISHDTVQLINLAYGIRDGMALSLWADYFVNAEAPMTGNLAAGSNIFRSVQGRFPAVGERLDMPMLLSGTYVTAVNTEARTVTFSTSNATGRSFTDYTCMNGHPEVEMFSGYSPSFLRQYEKTFIGGADFYQYDVDQINTQRRDFPVKSAQYDHYKILSTNFRGDTSLHKFKYRPLAILGRISAGVPTVAGAAPNVSVKINGNETDLQLVITASAAVNGTIVRLNFSDAWDNSPVAVLTSGNAFSANNSTKLFCNAISPSQLELGGELSAPGIYIINCHVGR